MDPGIEERRLPAIRRARFKLVIRPGWNRQLLDIVPVHIPEVHAEAAVGVLRPAFENGLDTLSRRELETEWIGVALRACATRCNQDENENSRPHEPSQMLRHNNPSTVLGVRCRMYPKDRHTLQGIPTECLGQSRVIVVVDRSRSSSVAVPLCGPVAPVCILRQSDRTSRSRRTPSRRWFGPFQRRPSFSGPG